MTIEEAIWEEIFDLRVLRGVPGLAGTPFVLGLLGSSGLPLDQAGLRSVVVLALRALSLMPVVGALHADRLARPCPMCSDTSPVFPLHGWLVVKRCSRHRH